MSYETLYKLHKSAANFEPIVPLERQPYYAAVAVVLALCLISPLFLSFAINEEELGQKENKKIISVYEIIKFILLQGIGSVFAGIAVVFLTNSFGVYV
ncbi:protein OST5 [Kluyveromyces marxianus]|uniref:Dolichyl-diphosphooligosaccharide-protein glycosyltransferase subunit OST5 n=1 Tax=Kluyveromyces marxianus TaxID=4911 RepID=A0ABX6EVZ2_KLUMA|nr:protein OST5 [Kluyveromyces marxianus]